MTATTAPSLTPTDLEQILSRVDPSALLVPPRILRRVIKKDQGLTGPGLQVPHRKSYVIRRDALLRIADRSELGLPPDRVLPDTLLLLPRPATGTLVSRPRRDVLLACWRLLFHARVHVALGRRREDGKLTDALVRARVRQIGPTEFAEARAVLRQEHFLLDPSEPAVYEEFAALYLELRYFDRPRLAAYFPGICCFEDVDRVLAQDVDAELLFAQTRPEGAPDPVPSIAREEVEDEVPGEEAIPTTGQPNEGRRRRLLARAERAAARGNLVRAAILRWQAARAAPLEDQPQTLAAVEQDVKALTDRLQRALGFPEAEKGDWARALWNLLEPAARGTWSQAARLLYDLQKTCIDQERAVYAVDLVEWAVTWGRRPIQRLLPNQGLVLLVRHLRGSAHRLTRAHLPETERQRLAQLLSAAVHDNEEKLRRCFHPLIQQALDEVDLSPLNFAEAVARDKLIEELLDLVVERGFLTLGDLRDAVARNQLKLPDLDQLDPGHPHQDEQFLDQLDHKVEQVFAALKHFFLGDQLIQANRTFACRLDGVYHRGEIYLRWLQRFSSLAFGTAVGRFLTRYLVLPFGGAFVALKGVAEVVGLIHPEMRARLEEAVPYAVGPLGLFLLALFQVAWFRRGVAGVLLLFWHGLRGLFYDLPALVLRLPLVRSVLQSRPYLLFYQYLFKPTPPAAVTALALWLTRARPGVILGGAAGVFLLVSLLLNSRLGMHIEEAWTDALVRAWHLFRVDLVPGLIRWVLYVFKRLSEAVERVLYTVDEWLRFRQGEGRFSLVWKTAAGLVWFFITYAVRVVVNLFVEPTVNPIKHFPVVTVAAKLMAPLFFYTHRFMFHALRPWVGRTFAHTIAGTVEALLPGLAGFLVWELKENWKLYRANRPATLQPEMIGSHGETMLRLMRPGLHSGTLPKLYARLRRKRATGAHRQREALEHVRERLYHFVERDLLAVLAGSISWRQCAALSPGQLAQAVLPAEARTGVQSPPAAEGTGAPPGAPLCPMLHVDRIILATNRVRIELACPALGGGSVYVDFEEHGGRLLAGLTLPSDSNREGQPEGARGGESWLARLGPDQVRALHDALAGFYKRAGVDLVRTQVEAVLPPHTHWDVIDQGLVVWPGGDPAEGAVYSLGEGAELLPQPLGAVLPTGLGVLPAEELLFSRVRVCWYDWVQTWEFDRAGKGHEILLAPQVRLLPRAAAQPEAAGSAVTPGPVEERG